MRHLLQPKFSVLLKAFAANIFKASQFLEELKITKQSSHLLKALFLLLIFHLLNCKIFQEKEKLTLMARF